MSTECYPTFEITIGHAALRAALETALVSTAQSSGSSPGPADLVVTIEQHSTSHADGPWFKARSCLTATWIDRFSHVNLEIDDACATASNATSALAIQRATEVLVANVATIGPRIKTAVGGSSGELITCTLRASEPVSQLTVELGEGRLGPFEGVEVVLSCLPKQNLVVRYRFQGQDLTHEVSPAMCAKAVVLPTPASPRTSNELAVEPSPPPPQGNVHMLQWYALIASTVFLASTLFVVLRNLFSERPINEGAARFLRIMISVFAAGFAGCLTGFLTVNLKAGGLLINAGAGLAFAVIVYFFNPGTWGSKSAA